MEIFHTYGGAQNISFLINFKPLRLSFSVLASGPHLFVACLLLDGDGKQKGLLCDVNDEKMGGF